MGLLGVYLQYQFVLLGSCLLVEAALWMGQRSPRAQFFRRSLGNVYAFLFLILLIPLIAPLFQKTSFAFVSHKNWDGMPVEAALLKKAIGQSQKWIQMKLAAPSAPTTNWPWLLIGLASMVAALVRVWQWRKFHHLRESWIANAFLLHRFGKYDVLISDHVSTPLSFRRKGRAVSILPSYLLEDRPALTMALRHETQHHRQGDTRAILFLELLQLLFVLNPFVFRLSRKISELQEFACDETLVGHSGVSPKAYAGCLLAVVDNQQRAHYLLFGTSGMAVGLSSTFLKRRVLMILKPKSNLRGRVLQWMLFAVPFCLLTGAVFAASSDLRDRTITESELTAIASNIRRSSHFPITVNAAVLAQVNYYIGTPKGREYMKAALGRMEKHRALVEKKLEFYGIPMELLALPITESGYKNFPPNPTGFQSAGVWQITPQTGRNFGLRVDEEQDDRMNVELATDAGLRYLNANYLRFQNWELSVLAYNAGENKVQDGIDTTQSKDAWTLIEKGFEGDRNYLPKVISAVIVVKSPHLLN